MVSPALDILLATYRGGRFLRQQLDSLLAQSDCDFRVLARDDGSDDDTTAILAEYAARHPGWLEVLPGDGVPRGARGNFAELLSHGRAAYAMFCDQDDRWHADKIAASRAAMSDLERSYGGKAPLMVHADLRVVDATLAPIDDSLARLLRLDLVRGTQLNRLLMHNAVTGCTMLMNRALIEAARPIPPASPMHDWWVALVASSLGHIGVLERPLIDYRQHDGNALGAMGMSWPRVIGKATSSRGVIRERLERGWQQADELLTRHGDRMDPARAELCHAFVAMRGQGFWRRRQTLLRHGFWMNGLARNLALMAVL